MKGPAKSPCGSCPYRQDAPSGLWAAEEYDKLPRYDGETFEQPTRMFACHQNDGTLCAGWVGAHDMSENLAVRLAVGDGRLSPADYERVLDYSTTTPLFASGAEAAEHGRRDLANPNERSRRVARKLSKIEGMTTT